MRALPNGGQLRRLTRQRLPAAMYGEIEQPAVAHTHDRDTERLRRIALWLTRFEEELKSGPGMTKPIGWSAKTAAPQGKAGFFVLKQCLSSGDTPPP